MPPPTIIMSVSTTSEGGLSQSAFAMLIGARVAGGGSARQLSQAAEGAQRAQGRRSEVHSMRSGAARPATRDMACSATGLHKVAHRHSGWLLKKGRPPLPARRFPTGMAEAAAATLGGDAPLARARMHPQAVCHR